MKRFLILAFLTLINLAVFAASPKLASEKVFDDLDVYDPSLSITLYERNNKIVRSVTFKDKPDLLKSIRKALAADKEYADSKSLSTSNGEIYEVIVINNEDEEIRLGLNTSRSKEVYFFMNVERKKNRKSNNKSSNDSKTSRTRQKTTKTKKTAKTEFVIDDELFNIAENSIKIFDDAIFISM